MGYEVCETKAGGIGKQGPKQGGYPNSQEKWPEGVKFEAFADIPL